jgi:hypothetical protein
MGSRAGRSRDVQQMRVDGSMEALEGPGLERNRHGNAANAAGEGRTCVVPSVMPEIGL